MKVRSHSESHLVELDDGSTWKIFPGDLDITVRWEPDTDVRVEQVEEDRAPARATLLHVCNNPNLRRARTPEAPESQRARGRD